MNYQVPVVPFYLRLAATTYVSHDDVVTLSHKIERIFKHLGMTNTTHTHQDSPCIEWECLYNDCSFHIHLFQSSTNPKERLIEMRCLDGIQYWWNVSFTLSRFFVPHGTPHRIL